MAQTYAAKYLMKAALSAPRDLVNSYVARFKPIHPTVLIFNCTFVCDARCEMCSNWQRGDRKSDMTLEQIDRTFQSPLWKNVEMCMLSGGEPTTRNDMVEVSQVFLDRLPKLRKYGINTTGLTPHRAIPMIGVAEACHEKASSSAARVDRWRQARCTTKCQVKNGSPRRWKSSTPCATCEARAVQLRHLRDDFQQNIDDCETSSLVKKEGLTSSSHGAFSDPMPGMLTRQHW
jgi:organic radical activating enzyme